MGVNTGTNRSRGGLLVQDNNTATPEDTVFAYGVREIIVTTGTLTNNGQGTVTITTGGGGGGSGTVTSVATAGGVNGLTLTGGTITVAGTITLGGTLAINNADWSGTALSATNGGTGLTTYTIGDIIYSSATNTLSKLGIGSAGEVLTVSGTGIPEWAAGGGGGTPAGSTTEIQFNNAGAFGASSRLTFNSSTNALTAGSSLTSTPVIFTQSAGDAVGNAGGEITSNTTQISALFGQGLSQLHEVNGFKLQPTDYQVKTGKTTTQSFGQTQNTITGLGGGAQVVDCYPSQGGLIVVIGAATAITVNLVLGQLAVPFSSYDSGAFPQQLPVGTAPPSTSNLAGYGTWQVGDQVTVLANLTLGQTPNITVRSYNSLQNGSPGIPSTAATAVPADEPSNATKINGVLSDTASGGGRAINKNYAATTFILCLDQTSTLGVEWVAIG